MPRRPTKWVAQFRVCGGAVVGAVLDISAHGAFFAPTVADELGAAIDERFAVGQAAAIAFDDEPNLVGLDLPCRVRWVGYSEAHGRHGVGIEFTGGAVSV